MKLSRIIIAGFACVSMVFAAANAATTSTTQKSAKTKSTASILSGKVIAADAVGNTLIVKVKKGEDTLSVDPAAVIKSGKKTIALSDLTTDALVTVSYKMVDGKMTATKITEKAAKAAKASTK